MTLSSFPSFLVFNKYQVLSLIYGVIIPMNSVLAKCRDPPNVVNANVIDSKSEYETGETVRYRCWIGYTIEGNSRITCNQDGTWSNIAFTCEGTSCRPPDKPNNGRIIGTIYTFGKLVEFVCNDGYLMYDNTGSKLLTKSPIRQCSADGSWTSYTPTCKVIECPDLADLHDGRIDLRSKTYGSVARYQCDAEFKLNGNSERMCEANGQWSGSEPTCEGITCPEPKEYDGGVVELVTFTQIGNRLIYRCNDGTALQAICKENGEWEPGPPSCMVTVAPEISTKEIVTAGPENAVTEDPIVPESAPVPTVIVIPIIFGILVIVCSVAGYFFWKKKKNDKSRKDPKDIIKPEELHHLSTVPSQQI